MSLTLSKEKQMELLKYAFEAPMEELKKEVTSEKAKEVEARLKEKLDYTKDDAESFIVNLLHHLYDKQLRLFYLTLDSFNVDNYEDTEEDKFYICVFADMVAKSGEIEQSIEDSATLHKVLNKTHEG